MIVNGNFTTEIIFLLQNRYSTAKLYGFRKTKLLHFDHNFLPLLYRPLLSKKCIRGADIESLKDEIALTVNF